MRVSAEEKNKERKKERELLSSFIFMMAFNWFNEPLYIWCQYSGPKMNHDRQFCLIEKWKAKNCKKSFFFVKPTRTFKKRKETQKDRKGRISATNDDTSFSLQTFSEEIFEPNHDEKWNEMKRRRGLVSSFVTQKNLFRINQKVSGTLNRIWQKNLNSARSEFDKKSF